MRIREITRTKFNQPFRVEGLKGRLFRVSTHTVTNRETIYETSDPIDGYNTWVPSSAETVQEIIFLSPGGVCPIYALLPKQITFLTAALGMGFYYMAKNLDDSLVFFSGVPKRTPDKSEWALGVEGNTARFIFDAPVESLVSPSDVRPLDIRKVLYDNSKALPL